MESENHPKFQNNDLLNKVGCVKFDVTCTAIFNNTWKMRSICEKRPGWTHSSRNNLSVYCASCNTFHTPYQISALTFLKNQNLWWWWACSSSARCSDDPWNSWSSRLPWCDPGETAPIWSTEYQREKRSRLGKLALTSNQPYRNMAGWVLSREGVPKLD